MSEILKAEYSFRESEKENELFDVLVDSRRAFLSGIRDHVKGKLTNDELKRT